MMSTMGRWLEGGGRSRPLFVLLALSLVTGIALATSWIYVSNVLQGGTTAVPPQSLTIEAEPLPEGVIVGAAYDIAINVTNPNDVSLRVQVVVNVTYLDGDVSGNVTVQFLWDNFWWDPSGGSLINATTLQVVFSGPPNSDIFVPPGTAVSWIEIRFVFEAEGNWEYTLALVV